MAQPTVIEGTGEEIAALLNGAAFVRRRMRVVIQPDDEDYTDILPDPPTTVRDTAHLEQLLLEGLSSPSRELTDEAWQELHRRAQRRAARKAS